MKSKATVYLLGFLVLGIWGMIMYRIYLSVNPAGVDTQILLNTVAVKKDRVPKLYPDTFQLLMDYPDPFTGTPMSSDVRSVSEPTFRKRQEHLQQKVQATDPRLEIKYLGFVSDAKGANRVAIVTYQGTEKMVKEGDTIQKVKVIAIKKSGLTLKYYGKITTINAQ